MNTVEEIALALTKLKSAVIFTHSRPDGDAIGSALALSEALNQYNIPNQVVNEGEIPQYLFFLEGAKDVLLAPTLDAEAYIAVDSSDERRFGELQSVWLAGRKKITFNIDHHVSNTRYAKYNYVCHRSSNCENIAEILDAMHVKKQGLIAKYLLSGIVTDSGCFSHDDVTGDTFRLSAELVDAGADVNAITYYLFKEQSMARAKLYAKVISTLRFELENRLGIAVVTQAMLEEYGLNSDATSFFVDFALTIDTVQVSVCILESKKNLYKISFRSKGKVDVNAVAGKFGGGGHVLASGCMISGSLEEVVDRLSYAVYQHLGDE